MDKSNVLLESILVSQILILNKLIEAEKKLKGITTTGDYINDAIREIRLKKDSILQRVETILGTA